jgi:CelD/BcsL family acetyltransferase involved in cellulose biosynthesis
MLEAEYIATVCLVRVTLIDDLADLQHEWRALFDSDPTATPFASFEWLSAWYRHWADGGKPWVLAVRDGDRIAGAAALLLRRRGGLRFLAGLGTGVGNYWDVIAAPGDREQVLAAVAAALQQRSSEWDAFFMDKLPEESATEAALGRVGLRFAHRTRVSSPRIELPDSFEDYLAGLSGKRRRSIRLSLRPIDNGELVLRAVTDPDDLSGAVVRLLALKSEWWQKREREMNPEHASTRFRAFTSEVVVSMVPQGMAELWEVCYRDEVIAVTINLLDDASLYGWLFGFDFRHENLRLGNMLIAYAIRQSIEADRSYFDFMVGDEEYKYGYAPIDRGVLSATVGSSRPRSRVALGLSHLKRVALPTGMRVPIFGRDT